MFSILVKRAAWGENRDSPHKWDSPAHGLIGKPRFAQNSASAEEHFAGLGVRYEKKKKSLSCKSNEESQAAIELRGDSSVLSNLY